MTIKLSQVEELVNRAVALAEATENPAVVDTTAMSPTDFCSLLARLEKKRGERKYPDLVKARTALNEFLSAIKAKEKKS